MYNSNVVGLSGRDAVVDSPIEMLRIGAQRLIHRAVEVELAVFLHSVWIVEQTNAIRR